MYRLALVALAVLALAACNSGTTGDRSGTDSGPGTDGGTMGTDAGGDVDAGIVLDTLVSGDWSLPPGMEAYKCVRVTVDHDIDVHRFHPVIPLGTHHTVLTIDPTHSMPDGTYDCSGLANGPFMLFGSGVGTTDLVLPTGISVHIAAGSQLVLNLHLFNVDTTRTLSGTSAIQIETMDPSTVTDHAEVFLAGKDVGLTVPGHTMSTQEGTCTPQAGHIFAVTPHMHQTGVHEKVTLVDHTGAVVSTLLDADYSFDLQTAHVQDPIVDITAGDKIIVDCTYDNPGADKTFGESTTDEMCYAGIVRWPAVGSFLTCTH